MHVRHIDHPITGATDGDRPQVCHRAGEQGAEGSCTGASETHARTRSRIARRAVAPRCSPRHRVLAEVRRWQMPRTGASSPRLPISNAGRLVSADRSGGGAPTVTSCASPSTIWRASCYAAAAAAIRSSTPARIVNVASAGQVAIDFDDVMLDERLRRRARLQAEQARADHAHLRSGRGARGSGVTVNCAAPGDVHGRHHGARRRRAPVRTSRTVRTQSSRSRSSSHGRSGLYFERKREARANAQAYDKAARDRLRALGLEPAGLANRTG